MLPAYAIGALDLEEERAVKELLSHASPEQQAAVATWSEMAALLPAALPIPSPAERIRQQLLAVTAPERVPTTSPEASGGNVLPFAARSRAATVLRRWTLLAASLLLALASLYLLRQNNHLTSERDRLATELRQANQQLNSVVAPTTKVVQMLGDEVPQANAKVIWDTRTQTWTIYIFDLPEPPSDKDYQLWYVTKDAKISAGLFRTDAQGRKVLSINLPPAALQGLAATAITLEPKGGSPQPTSHLYLKGAI